MTLGLVRICRRGLIVGGKYNADLGHNGEAIGRRGIWPGGSRAQVIAYEEAVSVPALKRGDDTANRLVAEKIIKIAQTGERGPEENCRRAVAELSRTA